MKRFTSQEDFNEYLNLQEDKLLNTCKHISIEEMIERGKECNENAWKKAIAESEIFIMK